MAFNNSGVKKRGRPVGSKNKPITLPGTRSLIRPGGLKELRDGSTRDLHPKLLTTASRVQYLTEIEAQGRWRDCMQAELACDWETGEAVIGRLRAEALRRVESFGQKETVQRFIQERLQDWVKAGGSDRVKAAELLLKTVGALTEKHEVTHAMANLSDEEVTERAIHSLLSNPATREKVRLALNEADRLNRVEVQLLSSAPLSILDTEGAEGEGI